MNDTETVFKKDVQIPSVTPKCKVPGETDAVKMEVQGQTGEHGLDGERAAVQWRDESRLLCRRVFMQKRALQPQLQR